MSLLIKAWIIFRDSYLLIKTCRNWVFTRVIVEHVFNLRIHERTAKAQSFVELEYRTSEVTKILGNQICVFILKIWQTFFFYQHHVTYILVETHS